MQTRRSRTYRFARFRALLCESTKISVSSKSGLNPRSARKPSSAVRERVLPSRIKWRCTNTGSLTALSRFHPQPSRPLLPWIMVTRWTWPICYLPRVRIRTIRNGGAVELGLHQSGEQWDSLETAGRNNRWMRTRIIAIAFPSIVRRGRRTASIGPKVAFRIHKSFLRGHSIRVDAILFRNYCRYYLANWPRPILGKQFLLHSVLRRK